MYVRNVKGSSRYPSPRGYSSWLEYWEEKSASKVTFCSRSGCSNSKLVGAHVQKAYSSDNKWYIIPLCESCNLGSDELFEVNGTLVPVPSNL